MPLRRARAESGFTLLELMIVVAILAIVASIGVPQYVSALRTARIGKAKHELVTIAHAIDGYTVNNQGRLPLTLYQVGFGGKRDPWGVPYCYLNYADGTGDGLKWAIDAGLVDPDAVIIAQASAPAAHRAPAGPRLAGFLPGAPQEPLPIPPLPGPGPLVPPAPVAEVATAVEAVVEAVVEALPRTLLATERTTLRSTIAASTGFTMFASVPAEQTRRRDRYMFPLNTDYDLFSLGPNGRTSVSLGETMAQDDVIRANNGGFFGSASEY